MRRFGKKRSGPAEPSPGLAAEIEAEAQAELRRVAQELSARTGVPPAGGGPPDGPPGPGPIPETAAPPATAPGGAEPRSDATRSRVRKHPPGSAAAGGPRAATASPARRASATSGAHGTDDP